MWLKMCPKCGGDLYLREEIDGNDIVCLQCGRAWPELMVEQRNLCRVPRTSGSPRIAA